MVKDTIQDIRKRCRLAMNGVVSSSMREKGLTYKINFGLTIQQIKELGTSYEQKAELAESLWKEDTRELKILATLLYPISEYNEAIAETWAVSIPNQEIREQLCFNLLQGLPFANYLAIRWTRSNEADIRTTGYWLLARLFLSKKADNIQSENMHHIFEDVTSENISLRNAALLALKHIGRQSKEEADKILCCLSKYKESCNLIEQEAYNSLSFEFEYYFE